MQTEVQVVFISNDRRLETLFKEEVEKAREQAEKYSVSAKAALERVSREASKQLETLTRNVTVQNSIVDTKVEALKTAILEMHQYHHRSILTVTKDYQMTAQRTDYLLTRCEMDRTEVVRLFGRLVDTDPVESHLFEEELIQEEFVQTRKLIHSLKSNLTQMNEVLNEAQRALSTQSDQQESDHKKQMADLIAANKRSLEDLKEELTDTQRLKDKLLQELASKNELQSDFDRLLFERDYTIKKNMGKIHELQVLVQTTVEDHQNLHLALDDQARDKQMVDNQLRDALKMVGKMEEEIHEMSAQINDLKERMDDQTSDLLEQRKRSEELKNKSRLSMLRMLEFMRELKVAKEAMQVDIEYMGSKWRSSLALLRVEYSTACKRYQMRVAEEHERTQGVAFLKTEEELKNELRRYRLLNENQARKLREFEELFEEKESRIQLMLNSNRDSMADAMQEAPDAGRQGHRAPLKNQPKQTSISPGLSSLRMPCRTEDRPLKRDLTLNQTVPLQLSSKGKGGDSVVNHKLKMFEEKYKKELDDILK